MRGAQWLGCVLALTAVVCAGQASRSPGDAAGGRPASSADTDWLNHVRTLYSSTARDGLKGFDCELHPDWHTLIASANNGTVDADGQHKVDALNTVRMTLHAHMSGSATVDWSAGDPPADLADMMKSIEDGTRQTLDGFVQFWAPFADASVVPANPEGITFTATADGGRVLHGADNGTEVTETFDVDGVLRQYDVKMTGTTVLFTPAYASTPKGLQVTNFVAHIKPDNGAEQELHVRVVYGEVNGFTIPSELYMTVVGTGTFNFTMSGCKVNP